MPVFSDNESKKNVLFVHIPKTAGTTVEKAVEASKYAVAYRTAKADPRNRITRCTPQHWHRPMLETVFELENFEHIFAIVRHPYTRFCSEYAMRRKNPQMYRADHVERWLRGKLAAYANNPFVNDNHFRPQVEFLVEGTRVFKLEEGLDKVFEYLNRETFLELPSGDVPRFMQSRKLTGMASSDVELSEASRALLNKFYREDFRRFGYASDLVSAPAGALRGLVRRLRR